MLEITPSNALDYLRERGWIKPGPARVEPLGGGVSNVVLRIETPDCRFVLKQSRPQLRTRAAWFSDLNRIYREQEVMEVLFPLLPASTVPEILFSDRANYVFIMSHAPPDAKVWKQSLLGGQVDLTVGERAGRVLGLIHEGTARDPKAMEKFRDQTVFVQLRVEPFYQRIQERCPDVADAVQPLVDHMMSAHHALCHGDFSPKNILTHERGFTLVDYETGHWGDPTMDLGFFLSHLILKAIKSFETFPQYFALTQTFWQSYRQVVHYSPFPEIQARAVQHCGVCALARIDGTSPVDYLPEEPKRNVVRCVGRRLLREKPLTWNEGLAICQAEMTTLK